MADRRITRQEIKHDEVADQLGGVLNWVEDNWQLALGIVAGIIVVALGSYGLVTWMKHSGEARSAELGKAASVLGASVQAEGARPTDPLSPSFASEKARDEAALAAIDAYVARNGTDSSAAYYRGVALMRLGRAAEAEESLTKAAGDSSSPLAGLARHALASVAMTRNDWATAEQRLNDLVQSPPAGYPKDLLMAELARAQRAGGKTAEARATEESLKTQFPDSPMVSELAQNGMSSSP
jgi:TolA-binding protein